MDSQKGSDFMASAEDYYKQMLDLASINNSWSAQQASEQMKFQERMSNTAHQREVADLKAAGLNPVLSAGGSGSSVPSGAMGQTDMSTVSALSNIVGQLINQNTAVQVANINAGASIQSANIMASASQYAADRSYEAQRDFPNSFAAIASRLINESGARSLWQDIFGTGTEGEQKNILELSYEWLTGTQPTGNVTITMLASKVWEGLSNLGSVALSKFNSWLKNTWSNRYRSSSGGYSR